MSKGVEKIEALKESLKKLAIAGKKISADGQVGISDLPILMGLLPELPAIIESIKGIDEAFQEVKDLDVAEIVKIIESVHAAVKSIEAA